MGAPEQKVFRGFIPKEQIGEASSWEFVSFGGEAPARGAPAQLSERERRAFERGLAQGRTEGAAAERKVKADQGARLDRVLAGVRARFADLEAAGADTLLDLAVQIARQVVRREIAVDREALVPVLREAVAMIVDQHAHPRVFLHPQDHALLRAELEADGLFKGCRFIADARVARGGCRLETAQGEVDATLATRWSRVLAALGIDAHEYPLDGVAETPAAEPRR
jgi:flagellar assembly protein FliH